MNKVKKCFLCRKKSSSTLVVKGKKYSLCSQCDNRFFLNQSQDEKEYRLGKAIHIARDNGINWGLALNVTIGKYTLQEAKRRQCLKNREKVGKSADIWVVARRRPGGYNR